MIKPYHGADLMGLAVNENHRVYQWVHPNCKILFSVTQRGGAALCHFASDKRGLRHLREAIKDFASLCFVGFDWCKMIIANVDKSSVLRLLYRLRFEYIGTSENSILVIRRF
jgi:hypothetical protein